MIYSETTKRAIEIARFAFNEMMAAKIAPTPPNFTVWYEYHSGRNAALRKAIEELKAQSRATLAGESGPAEIYPHPIAFNVLPQVEVFKDGDDYTTEERKLMADYAPIRKK